MLHLLRPGEIQQLIKHCTKTTKFRAATVGTLICLLACTSIRIGEVLRLTMADVMLYAKPAHFYLHETKFGKSRNVALDLSTVEQLRPYINERATALHGRQALAILQQQDLPIANLQPRSGKPSASC